MLVFYIIVYLPGLNIYSREGYTGVISRELNLHSLYLCDSEGPQRLYAIIVFKGFWIGQALLKNNMIESIFSAQKPKLKQHISRN